MMKVYRVFISSVFRCLEKERKMIADLIVKNNMLPIGMENFVGATNQVSLDIVKEQLDKCDVIIGVASFLYGSIVHQNKEKCALNNCNKCNDNACGISYTEFEWRYALQRNIPYYCFVNRNYNNREVFHQYIYGVYDGRDRERIESDFNEYLTKNSEFINAINQTYRFEFDSSDDNDLKNSVVNIISQIRQRSDLQGLIVAPMRVEPISYENYISNYLLLTMRNELLSFLGLQETYDLNYNGIRTVVVYYFIENNSKKRMTIFDLPQLKHYNIKAQNCGVVGYMNSMMETGNRNIGNYGVIYDFVETELLYLSRDNFLKKEKIPVKRMLQNKKTIENNCMALIAIPITDGNNAIVGALTFDLANDVRDALNKMRKECGETIFSVLLKKCKNYAKMVEPFLHTYIYSEYEYQNKLKH